MKRGDYVSWPTMTQQGSSVDLPKQLGQNIHPYLNVRKLKMTDEQLSAAKNAVAALKSSLEDHIAGEDYHDWYDHERVIYQMIKAFCLENE
jgi:hypothetical protein